MTQLEPMRATARSLVAGVGLALVTLYLAVAHVAGAVPPAPAFPGWMAVLVPVNSEPHEVRVEASPLVPGAPGSRPAVSLRVVACGASPFRAIVLMGGAARLSAPTLTVPDPQAPRLVTRPVVPTPVSGSVHRVAFDEDVPLRDAAWLPLALPRIARCVQAGGTEPAAVGTSAELIGELHAPVRRRPSLLGWRAPRESQSWPLVGRIAGVPTTDLGTFQFDDIAGSWMRPVRFAVRVSVGSLGRQALVESSRPATQGTEAVSWSSPTPIAPAAQVVDIRAQARWQEGLTAAGVGLGIGGSLLAALLFEFAAARSTRSSRPATQRAPTTLPETVAQRPSAQASKRPRRQVPRRNGVVASR
jgi:hypothetical protein